MTHLTRRIQSPAALALGSSATWLGAPRTDFLAGLLMLIGATFLLVFRFSLRTWEISPSSGQLELKGESHDARVISKMISPAVHSRGPRQLYLAYVGVYVFVNILLLLINLLTDPSSLWF